MSQRTPAAQAFGKLSQAAIALPGIGYQSPLVVGLRLAEKVADKTGASFLAVSAAMGVAGAALLIVTSLFQENAKAAAKASAEIRAMNATLLQIRQSTPTLTTGDLQAQLDKAISDLNIAEAFSKSANANLVDYIQAHPETTYPITGIISETLAGNRGQLGGLQDSADDASAAVNKAQAEVTGFTQALDQFTPTAADAAAGLAILQQAAQQIADAARQAALQAQGAAVGQLTSQGETYARANEMTAEQRRKEVERLGESIGAHTDYQHRLEAIQATLAEGTPEYQDYKLAIDKQKEIITGLTLDQGEYNLVFDSYADRLLRAAEYTQRITDQYDNYLEALDIEAKIRTEIIETIQKINDIRAEADEKQRELVEDTYERLAEIQADAAERMEKIAQDSADRIGKIMRDAGREQFAAVAERDALAFYQSQIKAKDALDDQKLADKRAIEQLAKTIAKQEAQLDKSYRKQAEQLYKSTNKQIEIQYKALQQQEVDLSNAQAALAAIALNGSGGLVVIQTNYWSEMNRIAVEYAANTVNTVNSIMNGYSGGSNLPGGLPGYQPWGGQGGSLSTAAFNRAVDNRIAQTLSFARTGRQFG